MKDITGTVETSGNVNAEGAVALQIDPAAMGHIMSVLSNMYSDKNLAVLREYSCNAWDAHIAAGVTSPIEVTLPSALQPSLLIQDNGVGLTKDEVISIYGTYGTSTKRDTNDQVGALGLGSKSAFTLGQQFVVTAVKDGEKTVALFALNHHNIPTVNILQHGATDQGNGVLVSLAVEDVDAMRRTADTFFATWPKGSVLVNGVAPKSVYDTGFAVNEKTHVVPGDGGVTVVMGTVGYPLSREVRIKVANRLSNAGSPAKHIANDLAGWYGGEQHLYFQVGIGDVDIAPSREGLRDTNRTLTTVEALVEQVAADLTQAVEEKVTSAATWREAYQALKDVKSITKGFTLDLSKIKWNGNDLKDVEVNLPTISLVQKSYRSQKKSVGSFDKFHASLEREERVCVVLGVEEADQGKVRRFAKRFLESSGYEWILLSPSTKGTFDWFSFDNVKTFTLDQYREEVKQYRSTAPKMVNEPSYDQVPGVASRDIESRTPLSEILESGNDLLLFEESTGSFGGWVLEEAMEDRELIVLLPTQSRAALAKRLPSDVEIVDGVTECRRIAQEAVDAVTDDQKAILAAQGVVQAFQYTTWSNAREYYAPVWDDIVNDDFKAVFTKYDDAMALVKGADKGLEKVQEAARLLGRVIDLGEVENVEIPDLDDMFPLLPTSAPYVYRGDRAAKKARHLAHGVAYLNGLAVS